MQKCKVDYLEKFKELVRDMVSRYPSNGKAKRKILEYLDDHESMRKAIQPRALEEFAQKRVEESRGKQKAASKKPNGGPDELRKRWMSKRGEQARQQLRFWDDYTIFGTKLKNVDYQLLLRHAERMEAQAEGVRKTANFEKKVLERLEPGDLVRDKWTLDELEQLRDEIWESGK